MRRLFAPALALLIAACDSAGGVNSGPLAMGIVSGNNQVAEAGAEQLADPVVGKLVRQPDGGITFRLVTPAYAQGGTVVNGSPVAGAVVCAVSVTEGGMVPFTPCTNTEADGTATFFFSGGTVAGEARSEIRGTVAGEPAVFDTASATVVAGPVWSLGNAGVGGWLNIPLDSPLWLDGEEFTDEFGNEIAYTLAAEGALEAVIAPAGTPRPREGDPGLKRATDAAVGDSAHVVFTRTSDGSVLVKWAAAISAIDPTEWDIAIRAYGEPETVQ